MTISPQIDSRNRIVTDSQRALMARFNKRTNQIDTLCKAYTPQLGLNFGMDRRGTPVPPVETSYLRPDGISTYFRPDGTSIYLRPT